MVASGDFSVTAGQSKAKNVSQLVKKVTSTKAATSSTKKPPMEHQKQSKESDPDNEGEWHQVPIKSPRETRNITAISCLKIVLCE